MDLVLSVQPKSYLMIENKTKNKTNYVNLYKLE